MSFLMENPIWQSQRMPLKQAGEQFVAAFLQEVTGYTQAYLGMQTFAKRKTNFHDRMKIDNTTAVSVINRMGTSHSTACYAIGRNIWEWCINRNIWVSAVHIPGKWNPIADSESRKGHRELVLGLTSTLLIRFIEHLKFQLEINLLLRELTISS